MFDENLGKSIDKIFLPAYIISMDISYKPIRLHKYMLWIDTKDTSSEQMIINAIKRYVDTYKIIPQIIMVSSNNFNKVCIPSVNTTGIQTTIKLDDNIVTVNIVCQSGNENLTPNHILLLPEKYLGEHTLKLGQREDYN